ncbi:MAG: NAD(P)H-binding protein [Planctomycetota bacterium]|nr:MAG: NAD(P)H-binding protein [Planctomycetota bacterium]
MSSAAVTDLPILLTGATGYVGGRLLKALEEKGYRVRCLARNPEKLSSVVARSTEIVQGDVLDETSLAPALEGVHTAYYLVHSMASAGGFEEQDRQAATIFSRVTKDDRVSRIIYLGGLGGGPDLSPHLKSRHEVGKILRESYVPAIEFQASIIIGAGSLSFEMIRSLVERLPVMVTPRWVRTLTQPIYIDDVIGYLIAAHGLAGEDNKVFEIGGPDRVSYLDIMKEYSRQRGLRRIMIPVPVLTPHLSSLWLGLVTPLYARVGRQLIEGVRNETIVHDESALEIFPIRPRGIREAVRRAIEEERGKEKSSVEMR